MDSSKIEAKDQATLLIQLIKVGQEGKVRPDTGKSDAQGSVCNTTGIVRDAKEASVFLTAAWKRLAVLLEFEPYVEAPIQRVEDLDRPNYIKRKYDAIS